MSGGQGRCCGRCSTKSKTTKTRARARKTNEAERAVAVPGACRRVPKPSVKGQDGLAAAVVGVSPPPLWWRCLRLLVLLLLLLLLLPLPTLPFSRRPHHRGAPPRHLLRKQNSDVMGSWSRHDWRTCLRPPQAPPCPDPRHPVVAPPSSSAGRDDRSGDARGWRAPWKTNERQ